MPKVMKIYGNSKSYSAEETRILESLIKANQDVVESKENNDPVMWQRKVDAWKQIGAEFELQTKTNRPWPALWDKYLSTRLSCAPATLMGKQEESITGEPLEQDQMACSTSITKSTVPLEDEWEILFDEKIKQQEVAQDYYKSRSYKQTGEWKIQLTNSRNAYKRRGMEATKKLLNIDEQLMELQGLANQIIYR